MAQRGLQLDKEKLSCSICRDLLRDPVTIPCGHSYCTSCIKTHWNQEDPKSIYSCPQCRETFIPRPVLGKNTMLSELVEEMKEMQVQAASQPQCHAGAGDVECDFCIGRKLIATKSCLQCLASYCESHLKPHYDSPTFQKHKLVAASAKIQENICSRHSKVKEIFCRSDQESICYLCSVDEHKGHDTVSAAAERAERQRELGPARLNIQQRIQDREKEEKLLQQEVEATNSSADNAVRDSQTMFSQVLRIMEKRSSDVQRQIRSQQETELRQTKELQEKLKQEIVELRRTDAELEQLSHSENHCEFLLRFPSLLPLSPSTNSASIDIRPPKDFKELTVAVSAVTRKLQDILRREWIPLTDAASPPACLTPEECTNRADFLQYSCKITLDPNTVNKSLALSGQNTRVTRGKKKLFEFNHPERFVDRFQVLSKESLTGRCYWEVEWNGIVSVAVAYKNISRTGTISGFGDNNKSWALYCHNNKFIHNSVSTVLSGPHSSRVGVFLDHREGTLSFYSVSGTMNLLHRVQTTFTQPLHAGICVGSGSAELLQLL
ncbi:E3 ubiquitin/ISG15 ligase TRIM25-like [Leuresthes tenuis]|uniref:E3 ubiquitin/ISG15 ligase TRIM25-like n=1 Tax=Leuresthes tenuis TaxID=355514 RepID=UPI003B50F32A